MTHLSKSKSCDHHLIIEGRFEYSDAGQVAALEKYWCGFAIYCCFFSSCCFCPVIYLPSRVHFRFDTRFHPGILRDLSTDDLHHFFYLSVSIPSDKCSDPSNDHQSHSECSMIANLLCNHHFRAIPKKSS